MEIGKTFVLLHSFYLQVFLLLLFYSLLCILLIIHFEISNFLTSSTENLFSKLHCRRKESRKISIWKRSSLQNKKPPFASFPILEILEVRNVEDSARTSYQKTEMAMSKLDRVYVI